jgi:hypothetical protein
MDSGPVATFQVHEYLRPKVKFRNLNDGKNVNVKTCHNLMPC